jgi:phage terminase large subunit-like protein
LHSQIQVFRDNLSIAHTACKYEPLSADYGTLDGLNPHGAIIDELHAHKDGGLVEKIRTAFGSRRKPLMYYITTAGVTGESIGYAEHNYARGVLEGMFDDDSYFAFISTIDEGDDPFATATWKKANPNYGVSVKPSMLKESAARAQRQAGLLNEFLRYHLNVWTSQSRRWMDLAKWDACPTLTGPNELIGEDCWVGLDLANTTDLAAAAWLFPPAGSRTAYTAIMQFWCPAERVFDRVQKDRVPYDLWIKQGLIKATPGNVIDYDVIRADLNEMGKRYSVKELGYDPWGATQIALQLTGDGFNCVPVRQGYRTLSEPTKFLEGSVLSKEFDHQGNAVLRWMASNVEVMTDPAGNVKPAKDRSTEKIDGIVAVISALSRIITQPDTTSVYETQPVRLL